jgi:hypothetical protein
LQTLIELAEQAPDSGRARTAIAKARRSIRHSSPTPQDYKLMLANTGRALECIAEGFAWAGKMKANGVPEEKLAIVVAEQNRKAAALLQI